MAANTAPTFVTKGQIFVDFGLWDYASSLAITPGGKIFMAGYSDSRFAVASFNSDGSLNSGFGGDGKVVGEAGGYSAYCNDIAIQADGKIVITGTLNINANNDIVAARYNADGSLDTTFNHSGYAITSFGASTNDYGQGIVIQNTGKIIVAGTSGGFAMVRYNTNGALDTTFGNSGKVSTSFGANAFASDVILQADGKILVVGDYWNGSDWDMAVARYWSNGSLDTTFSGDGKFVVDFGGDDHCNGVAVQADGKIVLAGSSLSYLNQDIALARLNANGSLDITFAGDGKVTTNFTDSPYGSNDTANDITVQANGKILVAGTAAWKAMDDSMAVVRYNANGTLDSSFSGDGKLTIDFGPTDDKGASVKVQGDGKIVVGGLATSESGGSKFALVRLKADGSQDASMSGANSLGGTTDYTKGGAAVVLDSTVTVFDAELAALNNYKGSSIALVRHGGANLNDVFSGAGMLEIRPDGLVLFGSTQIGTATSHANGVLRIIFNKQPITQAGINGILSSIAYRNTSTAPPATVQIDWIFNDGASLTATGSTTVNIVSVGTGITGTPDCDLLIGTAGINTINGLAGDDSLMGKGGSDILNGGTGNDVLDGGTGTDTMAGGIGNDRYVVDNIGDVVAEAASAGIDQINSVVTYGLSANVENLVLEGAAAINGTGNGLNNTLIGNTAANILFGGAGIDTMKGGLGNDTLLGGLGNDTLTGGAGTDTFLFNSALNAATNKDTIADFTAVDDTIRLDQTIFTKLTATGNLNSLFFKALASGLATDANDYILYNTSSGALLYDADANGAGVAVQFASLTGEPTITAADFIVVT